ncbi:transposase [Desulfonema magnum]|uniref:Transposase family protein, IS4-like n=1 Tax=Desulfonema magnum TaxID=45655 RepID=A0A975BNQ4_9BACT|nr:Transposase family protein, IS4-like [Desulfonema magnum]
MADVRTILAFYPIRWSVELFFKQFKSVLNIHKTEVKNN